MKACRGRGRLRWGESQGVRLVLQTMNMVLFSIIDIVLLLFLNYNAHILADFHMMPACVCWVSTAALSASFPGHKELKQE